jgi:2-polyprenyl-6-methoxyphenol hydroxylase-like FAD-dependent oxidoreductase
MLFSPRRRAQTMRGTSVAGVFMSPILGRKAVVVGASIAGMATARALADHFEQVVLLEGDVLPVVPKPRVGTPQCKHAHVLLAGGQRALNELFPNFEPQLAAAGAVPLRVASDFLFERPNYDLPPRDLGFGLFSMTRPLIESVVRTQLKGWRNIEIRERCRAKDFLLKENGVRARITGVRCEDWEGKSEEMDAAFVVDASGHGSLTLAALAKANLPAPEETSIGIDIGYATTLMEVPADAPTSWKSMITFPDYPRNSRGAFILPAEGNQWMVTLSGRYDEKPPGDWSAYLAHAKATRTSTAYDAIRGARGTYDIAMFGFKASRRRHFERLSEFPDGLLPVGDTVCRFNPIYGQGMSVACQEAVLLRRLLEAKANDRVAMDKFAGAFFQGALPIIETPWATAAVPDFLDPRTEGERPPDLENTLKFSAALFKLASDDAAVQQMLMEVQHLIRPQTALREPALVERVKAEIARRAATN